MAKLQDLLEQWKLTSLKLNIGFLTADFSPRPADRKAAWELYVELLTRITTQPLPVGSGDEQTSLESVHSLFATTREVLRNNGPDSINFAKIAIPVLNQIIRPFTARWHLRSLKGAFADPEACAQFRIELAALQGELQAYLGVLAAIALVEDIRDLEASPSAG
jgi:hypothetical protein